MFAKNVAAKVQNVAVEAESVAVKAEEAETVAVSNRWSKFFPYRAV